MGRNRPLPRNHPHGTTVLYYSFPLGRSFRPEPSGEKDKSTRSVYLLPFFAVFEFGLQSKTTSGAADRRKHPRTRPGATGEFRRFKPGTGHYSSRDSRGSLDEPAPARSDKAAQAREQEMTMLYSDAPTTEDRAWCERAMQSEEPCPNPKTAKLTPEVQAHHDRVKRPA